MKRKDLQRVIILGIIFLITIFLLVILDNAPNVIDKKISNFEECAEAGYAVMESYPRQCRDSEGNLFVEDISDSNRNYHSRDIEECSRTQILCIDGMNFFSDETGCGCEIVNDGKNFCTPESRNAEACITLYDPVCGWNDPEKIQCIKFPCANTYSNSCFACSDENVLYYTKEVCPL